MDYQAKRIIRFIRQAFNQAGKDRAVMAVSGGIDSALVLTLLTKALSPNQVLPVFLPYGRQAVATSTLIAEFNQIPAANWREINIKQMVDGIWAGVEQPSVSAQLRKGNIMARVRMIVIYDLAKQLDGLVCGTENRSEHELGYYTRFGDGASDLEPILHLYKTQVRQLAAHLGLPAQLINQPPSAGLWSGQTDEQELGFSYEMADRVLSGQQIQGLDPEIIAKIRLRVKANHYKKVVPLKLTVSKIDLSEID